MRTPSGDLHVVDFKTSQIVSAIQPKDYWDDKRHWEIKNNIDTLEFKVFENTDHAAMLVQQNLVLKEVRGGRIVPYVITEVEKNSDDRSLTVYASGEWIQLAKAGIIEPQKIESKTLKQCMEIALKGTKCEIGKIEHDGAHSMVIEEFTDPLDLSKKIAASFEVEIQYRAEVVGSQIVVRYVDMVKRRGRDTRKEITVGKDLLGIKRIENSQNICTALLGYVQKENGEFITISEINNGVPYLVDDAAFQRWNEKGKHKFAFYTPQTEDQDMSPQRLMTLMKTEMNKLVNTSVSYEVQAQSIGQVFGLAHELINEGDTIRIIDTGFTPKLYLEARAIAGDESFKDPTQDNYVFGDYREIVDQNDELRRLYQKILSSLYDKVPQELFDQLNNKVKEQNKDIIDAKNKADQAQKESQTAKDLAEATKDYMEQNLVDIIEQPTAPTENLRDGKTLWIDNSDPKNKVQKLWKDGAWIVISVDTKPLNTALTQAQNDITKAKQDITTNKGLLDTAKSEIQGNINTEKQRITDLTTTVGKKVDKTWIDQQLLDKADKSGVYTKDYIDQNTVGKQVYETDKAGNVQKFTDMSTDITRNANAIKSKAEQSSLDTTNNNVTGVTNRVTTVEQTATGLTTRIGSAESKINTATGDISSLKTKTNTIEQTANGSAQKITELTGQFTQKTNEIINTVETNAQKLTAVETTVKNAKYGRDNLIPNSGMFSNTGGWIPNTPASSTMEIVTEDGFNVMKIKGSIRASNPITLKPDTEYVYSALIKIPVDNVVSDGSGNPLHFWSTIGANPHTAVQRAILEPTSKKVLANTWTRVSYKFRTLAGAENTLFTPFMYSTELINSNAFFYVRYFQLIEGNQITEDWQAPSGDIVKKTNEIVQTVDSTISRVSAVENRKISSNNLVKASSDKMILPPKNTGQANDNFNFAQIPVEMQMDREYTVSARITFTKGTDTKVTVYPYTNGVTTAVDIQAGGYFTHTFKKINVNTTSVLLYAGQSGATRDKGCEFTEIMITEGNAAVPYSPPSPTIDEYTQKTTAIEQTATGLRTDINSVTNRTIAVENRAGTLETKTSTLETKSNTMRSDLDGNITAINSLTETVTYAGENFLDKSSANNEFPSFLDDAYYLLNKATGGFFEDYYIVTCSDYTDAFYQIGNSSQPTNMHGFKANDSLTLSMDLQQDLVGTQTVIFQHDGTSWSEAEIKTYNHAVGVWTRVSHSFTLKANTKGFMIRIRFPRVAGANTKKLRFRKLKLEYGSLATQWNQNSVEIQSKTNMIKQTTDENSMKLTSIDASGIAGANLVYNTDLLQRPTNSYPDGWAVANTSITIWQNPWADEPRAGVFRFNRTNLADADPNNIVNAYSNKFPVARNKDYTWSVWMYVPTANWSAFKVKNAYIMEYFDNAGTRVQYQDVSLTTAEQTSLQAGNWTRITRTFRPTTAGIVTGAFRLALFHNGDIYYRMPQVELGTVATGWNRSTVDFAGNYQFNDLNTRSNEIKQTLDGTVSSVNSLSSTVGTHTTQITQQGTTISQMNNEINSRVKTTEMTDYIGKLGAENELRNTAFETKVIHATTGIITSRTPSLDKWSFTAGKVTAETTRNREGYNSAKILATGETADKYHGLNQSIPASISSGDYVFGAWFYVQDKALLDQGAVIKLQFFNGATASTTLQTELAPKLVNNGWVYAEVKITAPATTITTLRADIWVRRNGTLWVSQPMLQYGFNASAFMENPQDYVNYDALVGEVAKKVATMDYNSKITTIESSIKQANNAIDLRVLSTDVYKKTEADGRFGSKAIVDTQESAITLLKNQITLKVEAGGIASAINQTAQSVLIQAGKIYLDGFIEAKHLKAQELVGVTIKTVPNGQQRYVKLNQQNIELYDRDTVRGEFRFFNKSDGTSINPTITLGRSVSGGIVGALNISQWTPINAQGVDNYQNAQAAIGMVDQYNSNSNEFTYGSRINFFKNGQMDIKTNYNLTLSASQQGHIQITTDTVGQNKSIFIEPSLNLEVTAGNSIWLSAKGGSFNADASTNHTFKNGSGNFYFENTTKTSGNNMLLSDDNHNADLRMAYVKIRSSHDSGYQGKIQLVQTGGGGYAGLECADVSYTSLTNRSSRKIKSNIRDLEIDALDKVMNLKVQQYNFKSDVEKLYKMREDAVGSGQLFTTRDIPLQYGLILEDTDSTFVADLGDGINLYTLVTLNVDATQKIKLTQDVHEEEISILKSKLASQEDRIAKLEELLLQQLIDKKPERP